ncbi:MAG: AhpC/TSA family protein [Bacteroidaceae bacterium]|nr:AhpC/TSA family protein [Bacteroidaceae bacterium]
MKKILLLALPALLMSCNTDEYTINGKTNEQLNGQYAYLLNEKETVIDSCLIENGSFTFSDTINDQKVYMVQMDKQRAVVFVEKGRKIEVNATESPIISTDNGGLNDKYNAIMDSIAKQAAKLRERENKMHDANATPDAIRDTMKHEYGKLYDYYRAEILANKDNQIGSVLLGLTARSLYPTIEALDSMCNVVKYAKDNAIVISLKEQLMLKEKTKEGKMYTDFGGLSETGKLVKLSDFVGKGNYVLVDFWASWCRPCKAEMPNLVKLHNKFKNKGLTIVGVNISDQEGAFKHTLKVQKIEYPQIMIPPHVVENGAKLYNVTSIPHIMLIAPDGTIVKRGLRGEEMMTYIEEVITKKL